jgi:peptide/nickel transport system permease protein
VGARRYVIKKVLYAVLTLWFVITFNFVLFRVLPSDPIAAMTRSQRLSPADVAELRQSLGLDQPIPQQYVTYMADTLRLDFGRSIRSGAPVWDDIAERIPPTLWLLGLGTIFSTLLGIWIGIKGGWSRGGKFDTSTLFTSQVFWAMSEAWLGMLLIVVFSSVLGWFPAGQYQSPGNAAGIAHFTDLANHLFLPVLTLTLAYFGEYTIIMRSSLIEVMNEDFVTLARAKGLPNKAIRRRHVVPNAFLPTFTLIFLSFGFVLSGAILIEVVFSWPGIGQLEYQAIQELDYPLMQGLFLISSAAVILFNLIADITYSYMDPRIREG